MSDSKHGKAFGLFWAFIIVALPIYHRVSYGMSSRDYKDGFFYMSCAISLACFRKQFKSYFAFVFLIMAFFGIKSVNDNVAFFHMLGIALSIGVMFQFATHWEYCKKYINYAFCICLLIQCAWIVGHVYNYDLAILWNILRLPRGCTKLPCQWPVAGSLDNGMVTAAYIAPIVPFALSLPLIPAIICLIVALVSLLILKSAMGFFGVLIATIYILTRSRFITFSSMVFCFVITPILSNNFAFFDDSTRYGAWASIIENIGVTWTGKGLGYFYSNGRVLVDPVLKFYHEHNEYLSLYISCGFFGVLIISLFLIDVIKFHRLNSILAASFFATLAVSYGAFPLHISSSALTFIIACGGLMSYSKDYPLTNNKE